MAVFEKAILAAIAAFCAILFIQSLNVRPPAQTFPLYLTGLTGLLALVALARAITTPLSGPIFPGKQAAPVLAGAAGLVVYAVAMSVSYLAATAAFLFLGYLFLMPNRTPGAIGLAAVIALAMTGFTWLCFGYWLGVNLP